MLHKCLSSVQRLDIIICQLSVENLYSSYVVPSPKESNPFLALEKKEDPTLDIALDALAVETSRRTSSEQLPLLLSSKPVLITSSKTAV